MNQNDLFWMWFANTTVISRKKKRQMLEYFGSPYNIYMARQDELQLFVSGDKFCIWEHEKDLTSIEKQWNSLAHKGVHFCHRENNVYPQSFCSLEDYPLAFYYKGKLPRKEQKLVAVIGSRNASFYGMEVTGYFAKELARNGVGIVSGLALGIDAASHQGALEVGGYTIGIIGGGIHTVYPKENYNLYMRMEEDGGILSEYLPDASPKPYHFPERNRLISALADAVLVVEAKEKSGTFITVDQGLEQGKDIFAIPGRITDENSIGCIRLISQGARPVVSPNELLKELGLISQNETLKDELTENLLAYTEKIVYSCVRLEPIYIEEIIQQCQLSPSEVLSTLLSLEIKGYIKQIVKSYYVRVLR